MEPSCTRSAFGCHEGRKLLSHCSSSVTALCSGADLPQTSFSRFWSPYIKKLWQPSLSCQVPENRQHRGDLAGGGLSLSGLPGAGQVVVCPPLPSTPPPTRAAQPHLSSTQSPRPAAASSPSPTYLPQPGSDLSVRVCQCVSPVLVADREPPGRRAERAPHTGCVGCGAGLASSAAVPAC